MMKLLKVIYRNPGVNKAGKTITREAVRGIILQKTELLMIHSEIIGEYKFPGGGVQAGETYTQALAREVLEECGVADLVIGQAFGKVIEYDFAAEVEFETFCMTSYYFLCRAGRSFGALNLDDYELELGFHPVWVEIEQAIRANRCVLEAEDDGTHPWTARDTWVLEQVKIHFNL